MVKTYIALLVIYISFFIIAWKLSFLIVDDGSNVILYFTAAATLLAALVALLKDDIDLYFKGAKLKIVYENKMPFCDQSTLINNFSFFRIGVMNVGKTTAKNVSVIIECLDGPQKKTFVPISLVWTHISQPYMNSIQPNVMKYCDVGKEACISNQNVFYFETEKNPNSTQYSIFSFCILPVGKHQFVVRVVADNAPVVEKILFIETSSNNLHPVYSFYLR